MLDLDSYPALHLNADYRPTSYFPLSTLSWQEALKGVISGSHIALDFYKKEIHSAHEKWMLPSVVVQKTYTDQAKLIPSFSRVNVYLRDNFTCQYTGRKLPPEKLNFDHVIPKSKGGKTCWENIVTCDIDINSMKGNRYPHEVGLKLIREPFVPTIAYLNKMGMKQKEKIRLLHREWIDYLYWDSQLEN